MRFCDRIKLRREELNLSQDELAKRMGYKSRSSINKIELGLNDVSQSKIIAFAEALNTTVGYLMGDDEKNNIGTPYNPVIHKIPVLGCISAGLPLFADEHIESYTYTERNGGAEYFALRVKGDSMSAAQINDKNLVIVRRQDVVDNGEIAVVRVNKSEATIKRFRQDGKIIQLIPQSFNPVHEVQFYDLDKDDIEIIGKVVECKVEF